MQEQKYLEGVTTLQLDAAKCTGCGLCAVVCPHAVFAVRGGQAEVADRDACMECGACAKNCPAEAISVESGVGCAYGIMMGAVLGTAPTCDCSRGSEDPCCG